MLALLPVLIWTAQTTATPLPNQTITLGEVKRGDAMALAPQLLPPELRAPVRDGAIHRVWLPGQVHAVRYREAPVPAGGDLCRETAYSVQLSAPDAPGDVAPDDTALAVGPVERSDRFAVVAGTANARRCAAATGFVQLGRDRERQVGAYRTLLTAMRDARGGRRLPFAIECTGEDETACADGRTALATLPLDALFAVEVRGLKRDYDDPNAPVRIVTIPPIVAGDAYDVEMSFGTSGRDGRSWRVRWRTAGEMPAAFELSRSTVIYH